MADVLESMLLGMRDAFEKVNRKQIDETKRLDDILDKLNTAIKAYLTSLDPEALSEADHRRLREILTFATNLEHAGDVVDKNLLGIAAKIVKRGVTFSKSGRAELLAMIDRLIVNVRTAASLFMTGMSGRPACWPRKRKLFVQWNRRLRTHISNVFALGASILLKQAHCISTLCETSKA